MAPKHLTDATAVISNPVYATFTLFYMLLIGALCRTEGYFIYMAAATIQLALFWKKLSRTHRKPNTTHRLLQDPPQYRHRGSQANKSWT